MKKNLTLDNTDWKLIKELFKDPRQSVKELAERIHVHRNTVSSKLAKNIYTHFIFPNYTILNYITAYVFSTVKANNNNKETAEKISKLKGVEDVSVISGEWDFIIKIRAKSIEQIGETIIEEIRELCDQTVTSFSFWSFISSAQLS